MSPYFQIITLVIVSLLILYKIRGDRSVVLLSTLFALYTVLQIVSVYLTGNVIDYRFYSHSNLDDVMRLGFQFLFELIVFTLLFIVMSISFYFVSKKVKYKHQIKNRFLLPVLLSLFVVLSLPTGVLSETYKIYEILSAEEKEFDDALADLGILSKDYITPDQVRAAKGKNIIVISMESIEQGFLGPDFGGIAPNLKKLSKDFAYYNNMPVIPGGGWTAASLYNHQVGMPAFFQGQGNDFFQGATDVKLLGLGHVLNKAGYNSMYLVGNAEAAGMSDILNAYGMHVVSENNSKGIYPKVGAGLNDLDLFKEAKLQIIEAKKLEDPFALFMSTINTHFPNGIYDKRMEEKVEKRENILEFSVSSLDYLVGDFVNFLKQENLLDDTVIFLFPDHPLMGSQGAVIEKLSKSKRQLYLITNADEDELFKKTSETIYQIDLPNIILGGAGIKTNAKFLTDFIDTKDVISYIKDNRVKLTALNSASLKRKDFASGISISIKDDNLLISSSDDEVRLEIPKIGKEHVFDVTFNSEMVLIYKNKSTLKKVFNIKKYDMLFGRIHLIVHLKNGEIFAYLGDKQKTGMASHAKNAIKYSSEDVQKIMQSSKVIKNLSQAKYEKIDQTIVYDSSLITVTSSEYVTLQKIQSAFKINGKKFRMTRGLNILHFEDGVINVEHFDTHGSKHAANNFIARLAVLIKNNTFFVVAAQDSIRNEYPGYKEKLISLGFKILAKLNGRLAYISYFDANKKLHEYSSKSTLTHVIPNYGVIENKSALKVSAPSNKYTIENKSKNKLAKITEVSVNKYSKDVSRFIAHAGGEIDGVRYTDSLEALELSYKLGFRLLELDIIKTSDDVYVAAHDWKHWAAVTGYKGNTPPSLETFKKYKINGKYTTLDMKGINVWFANHPDAVLVTDKVNTPLDFSSKFVDKNRLMMELFSLEAVKEGVKANIKSAMPSWSVLSGIKGDKLKKLKNIGVTEIAASRRVINNQKPLLDQLTKAGIRIYAFHVNFDHGKDESYVVCNEMDHFYGLYADKWNFKSELDCNLKH